MKRDMDLVRRILLALEAEGPERRRSSQLQIEGDDNIIVGHHVHLLAQAGLVRAVKTTVQGEPATALPLDLTWDGHEYLNAIRDEGVWNSVKAKAGSKLGSLTFDVVKELAVAVVRGSLGLPSS